MLSVKIQRESKKAAISDVTEAKNTWGEVHFLYTAQDIKDRHSSSASARRKEQKWVSIV